MMITGEMISKNLCTALGLPPMTRGFALRCYTGKPVTVECEYYPHGSFQTALAQYHLVPNEPAADLKSLKRWASTPGCAIVPSVRTASSRSGEVQT